MFQGAGLGGGTAGGFGGANPFAPPPAFPAPGNPNPTSTPSSPSAAGQTPSSTTTPGATPGAVPPFPLFGGAGNLPAMQQMFGMPYGPGAGGLGGFGGFGGAPAVPATPADTRPPEERFQVQLQVRLFILILLNVAMNNGLIILYIATAGNGTQQRVAECEGSTCHWWECTGCD